MKNLERRIIELEKGKNDPYNDLWYELVCQAAELQGKPKPEKQNDIGLTTKQLAGYLEQGFVMPRE